MSADRGAKEGAGERRGEVKTLEPGEAELRTTGGAWLYSSLMLLSEWLAVPEPDLEPELLRLSRAFSLLSLTVSHGVGVTDSIVGGEGNLCDVVVVR